MTASAWPRVAPREAHIRRLVPALLVPWALVVLPSASGCGLGARGLPPAPEPCPTRGAPLQAATAVPALAAPRAPWVSSKARPGARPLPSEARPGARPFATPPADTTLDFPYRDARLLHPGERHGGRVLVPGKAQLSGAPVPLVVVLHGRDLGGRPPLHELMAGNADLRPVVARLVAADAARPVLLAAPSQTRAAEVARTLWTPEGFELASFVEAVARRLAPEGITVDRGQVAVLGHSGAACHLAGDDGNGVFQVARRLRALASQGIRVRWLGLMDGCFFGAHGAGWLRRALDGTEARVAAMWTDPEEWGSRRYRKVRGFTRALGGRGLAGCAPGRYARCLETGDGWWVIHAREPALRRAFGRASGRTRPIASHYALPRWLLEELLVRWLPAASSPERTT